MARLIAFCGLDCGLCEGYIATQANDQAAKERVAAKWQKEYNAPNMTAADVTCDGCITTDGCLGSYCPHCPIRACGRTRGITNCAYCVDYAGCDKLAGVLAQVPAARETLEAIRRTL